MDLDHPQYRRTALRPDASGSETAEDVSPDVDNLP
jgi:hypothetical protein